MGIPIVTSARINKNQVSNKPYLNEPLFFETFRSAGLVKTSSLSHHVTDSAAGAVALVTGRKIPTSIPIPIQALFWKNSLLLPLLP
ncbi:hypothetical protein ANCDUO_12532 [Ancylostoma duodenale]|uniref:alkaline phosphatase n=2 Tax=Ancylostoma TaxID=29169 RepID=A0A0C2CL62_9BILA|nr:hypothetical protein ANCDUO_12532 [Ancylostoma duodenale]